MALLVLLAAGVIGCWPAAARPAAWARPAAASLLPADQAFQLLPVERRGRALHVEWNVAPGYYLYRERLAFELIGADGVSLGKVTLPAGQEYHDEHFGKVEIYRGIVAADFTLSGAVAGPLRIRVGFQGCADAGVCYPPQIRIVDVHKAGP